MTSPVSQDAREAATSYFRELGQGADFSDGSLDRHSLVQAFDRAIKTARKDEAEKCAALAEEMASGTWPPPADVGAMIAAAIRARHAEGKGDA